MFERGPSSGLQACCWWAGGRGGGGTEKRLSRGLRPLYMNVCILTLQVSILSYRLAHLYIESCCMQYAHSAATRPAVPPTLLFRMPLEALRDFFSMFFLLLHKIEPSKRKSEPRGRPKSLQSSPRPPQSFQNGAPFAPRGSFFWFRRTSVFE